MSARQLRAREEKKIEEALAQGINPEELDAVRVSEGVTVAELADALEVPANDIIKRLFLLGTPLTMTQSMSNDLVELVADDLGRKIRIITPEEENSFTFYDDPKDLKPRPPVVTVMGSRRPRQDELARRYPSHRYRRARGRRHHAAHRCFAGRD